MLDEHGVIAPWYRQPNGQADFRVRIAAETLKRYPWTDTERAIAAYPDYLFTSFWQISPEGVITPQTPTDWMNGDLGQRATSVLNGMVDYYRYSGDPAAIAHLTYMGDFLIDHCLTPEDHAWPRFPVSVPTKGKPYWKTDPAGMIQLDICGSLGHGLLRAYQVTGNQRWFDAARHWGDLFAKNANLKPAAAPWPRYANPETAPWDNNEQTGGVTMILAFLDELIRLGHTGDKGEIVAARDAGLRYLREQLLPQWSRNETWAYYFWDWVNNAQNCLTTADVAGYMMNHRERFPNWRNDARNMLSLFLNRSSAMPESGGDVYSGAWAYPESSSCCGRSLWYSPLIVGAVMAQFGVEADDAWGRELAYRQMVLQTYDAHETGVTEDNIDGGVIVNGKWLNLAHPWPLRWVLMAIGWLPEELGASRENHVVRSTAVVSAITYGRGRIEYTTFDAPPETLTVARLSFAPSKITAEGRELRQRRDLQANGYTIKEFPNGDAIVHIRHDGAKNIAVLGPDPQTVLDSGAFQYAGAWTRQTDAASSSGSLRVAETKGASASITFRGNQVRLIGRADPFGGKADVLLNGEKQMVAIDFWNPAPRDQQVLYYRNGLEEGEHTLEIVARGERNPCAQGARVYLDAVQFSAESGVHGFPTGAGPTEPQRLIFGYPKREDYRDANGNLWRPGAEIVTRLFRRADAVAECWWTNAAETVAGTVDAEVYRYGYHAPEFWVNLTVGPGNYDARLKFAATRGINTRENCFDIFINGDKVAHQLDVAATAGGPDKAVDLLFKNIAPQHGVIEIRFQSPLFSDGETTRRGEAFVQALELGQNLGGKGAVPVSSTVQPPGNLLLNAGFEELAGGAAASPRGADSRNHWSTQFRGKTQSSIWQENDSRHSGRDGMEVRSGEGALRTYTDGDGQTTVFQDIKVKPNTAYTASVWVRTVDRRGKGFGHDPADSAALLLYELNEHNQRLVTHQKVEHKEAAPYTLLTQTITTGPTTAKVRFILDTIMKFPEAEGHVTYDDCSFSPERKAGDR